MIRVLSRVLNTKNKRTLINNFFSLVVLRGFQFLIPLITLPYLVRVVGIEKFGLINFALSFGMYFGAIIQFGFSITATREIARHCNDAVLLKKIYSSTLFSSVLLALLCIIIFLPIVFLSDRFNEYQNLYFYTLTFVVFQSLFPVWYFQGIEKMKYITFLSLGANVTFLIGLFLFVKTPDDFVLVVGLNAASACFTFVISILIIQKHFKTSFSLPKITEVRLVYINGYHAFISQLAPNLYNNSSVFILGLFTNTNVVGLYVAATKVIDAVLSLSYILSNTFLPYLSRDLTNHGLFKKIMMVSGGGLTVFTGLSAQWISEVLFGPGNIEISEYIQWLSISIFLVFAIMTFGTNYLMLIGKDFVVKDIAVYTSLVFFVVALIIIPKLGAYGAIITLVGARLTMALLQYICYLKAR